MRRALGLFLLSCHAATAPTPSAPRVIEAPSAASAEPIAPPAPTAYDAFVSTDANPFMGWQILFARRNDQVRILVRSRGTAALPVELTGNVTAEGARLRVHASSKALSFEGLVDGDALQGTLRAGSSREVVRAKRGVAPIENGTTTLGAEIAGRRFEVAWQQEGARVKAVVRDPSRSRALEGTMHDGRFELAGDGVTSSGVMSGLSAGVGEWREGGKTQLVTFDLLHADVPTPYSLPGGARVVPLERWSRGVAGCPSSYEVLPQIEGLGMAVESTINRHFAPKSPSALCNDATEVALIGAMWSTVTYTVTAAGPGWFATHADVYTYLAGAHGMSAEWCQVVSLATGKATTLQLELPDPALVTLGGLVRAAILASAPGKSLVDLGFNADDAKVTHDRVMCAVLDHGAPALEVLYQRDMDEAGNFRFTDVRPRVPAAKVRALFPPGSLGALVFQ